MTELKRPERYVPFESIKPKLSSITNFYTQKVNEYWNRIKQLNEYADALENEISILKGKPKVKVLLDNTDKRLVVVPQLVADFIEERKESLKLYGAFHEIDESYGTGTELYDWLFANVDSQELFARAWLDGYTVEKEQLFYLKHIDFCKTDKHYDWFTIKFSDGPLNHLRVEKGEKPSTIDCKFTKQEIESMEVGSYEQIKVKVEEVEK